MDYPHLAARIFDAPLLIYSHKLETILKVMEPRFLGRANSEAKTPHPMNDSAEGKFTIEQGVAIIPITGTLVTRAIGLQAMSGMTSYHTVQTMIEDALTHPAVNSLLLDIDSPGGEAAGCFDLSDFIYNARGTKPIVAIANSLAASAAYAIASAADQLLVTRLSSVGSIGVITAHIDQSQYDAQEGFKYTLVYAGAHKADLSPHAPLSADAKDELQARVDQVHTLFIETVARNRGITAEKVRSTEARVFMGEEAVSQGLADGISTLSESFTQLATRGRAGISLNLKEKPMTSPTTNSSEQNPENTPTPAATPAPTPAPEPASEQAPADAAALAAQATAATSAEILSLASKLGVSMELTERLIRERVSLTSAKVQMTDWLAANKAAPVLRNNPPALSSNQVDPNLPVEERCKQEWEKSADLRAEFGSLSTYTAFKRAEESGRVRIFKGNRAA